MKRTTDIAITLSWLGIFLFFIVGCVVKPHPNLDVKTYINRAQTNYNQGNYDQAIYNYTMALKINPNDAICFNSRGNAYYSKSKYGKAISDYDKAIKINTNYAAAFHNRAVAYYKKGLFEKAWDDVIEAQFLRGHIAPNFIEALCEATAKSLSQ